jgi:hypothetical protein
MLRRIFLTAALERLLEEGLIRKRSAAFRVMRLVIEHGAGILDDDQRALCDREIVPQIERLRIAVSPL